MPTDDLGELDERQLRLLAGLLSAEVTSDNRPQAANGALTVRYQPAPDGTDGTPTEAELRAYLRRYPQDLPEPERLVAVARLPRHETAEHRHSAAHEAPVRDDALRGDTERWVAGVWTVLGIPARSRDTDFFAAGGSSLRAVQVLGRIQSVLGIEIDLVVLFEHRTVADLAAHIEAQAHRVPGFADIVSAAAEVYGSALAEHEALT